VRRPYRAPRQPGQKSHERIRQESNLDLVDLMTSKTSANGKIDRTFALFHKQNPRVYETLTRLARDWHLAGHGRCGIGMLWEVMRWEMLIAGTEGDVFKLNNNFRSRYVRLLLSDHPEWATSFELRALRS
jgi:hypothetical protein